MTQEFHISVTPLGNDEYLIRTERVAPGVPLAEEQVVWPVETWLTQARQLMNDPLMGLLQGYSLPRIGGFESSLDEPGSETEPSALSLVELGQQLYAALFQGSLRDSWMTAQGIAQHRSEMLRLRLGLKGVRLHRLPWEVMYGLDGSGSRQRDNLTPAPRAIATGTDILFSRYQPSNGLATSLLPTLAERDQPLRILMAIAAPTDQERLELTQEALNLQRELRNGPLAGTPDIQLTILEQPGREQLTQALEQGQFQIFHFAGHSNLGVEGGNLYLVNHRTGLTEPLSGDDLAGLLVNNGVCMAVLNSCRGAHTATADPQAVQEERNLAEALVGRGIPAVLAMAERIPDDVALNLTQLFYRNLKQGYPIDLSVNRARQGLLSSYGSHQFYWALPILYMASDWDGYLMAGDRAHDNPADHLATLSPLPDPIFTFEDDSLPQEDLPVQDSPLLDSPEDLAIITRAILGDDDFSDFTDEFVPYPLAIAPEGYSEDYSSEEYSSEDYSLEPRLDPQPTNTFDFIPNQSLGGTEVDQESWLADSDETYAEDAALVSELIRQLTDPPPFLPDLEAGDRPFESFLNLESDPVTSLAPTGPKLTAQPPEETAQSVASGQRFHSVAATTPVTRPVTDTRAPRLTRVPPWLTNRYLVLPLVGVGIAAIAAIGFRLAPNLIARQTEPSVPVPSLTTESEGLLNVSRDALKVAETNTVTAIATASFVQNRLPQGQQAMEELLNRGTLAAAQSALDAVPPEQLRNPQISFLRGRLAWEAIKQGNRDFSVDDVRRYWMLSVAGDDAIAAYHTSLGFAYYAEGKSRNAVRSLCRAMILLHEQKAFTSTQGSSDCPLPDQPLPNSDMDVLTTMAGLALALQQGANDQSMGNRAELMNRAVGLNRLVMLSDPIHFQPATLGQGWLWTESLIQDWRSLIRQES